MATQDADFRYTAIRKIHKKHKLFYQVIGGLFLVLLGVWVGAHLFADDTGYSTNLYTEFISVGLTVFVLNQLAENREAKRREDDLHARLVREARSRVNSIAVQAIEELRDRGLLEGEDGLLQGKDLTGANLENANLGGANLENAHLIAVNLKNVNMARANLKNANLVVADLEHAILHKANLENANLVRANLKHVILLESAIFTDMTILPDAVHRDSDLDKYWTPTTDLSRYTNSEHTDFWQPEWVKRKGELDGGPIISI